MNRKLLDLNEIYVNFTHSKIWVKLMNMKKIRDDINYFIISSKDLKEKEILKEQMFYMDENINTLEVALLCHETKFIEKRTSMGELGEFYLN